MKRTLNRVVMIGSAATALLCFWNRNALPKAIEFNPRLSEEPHQQVIDEQSFNVQFEGVSYRIEPKYDYELYGLVVSYRQHDGESLMHRMANDHLNMADVCVVWSDTAFSEHLRKLNFWNGIFTCNVQTSDSVAWSHFKMNQLSNNHLLSADPGIRARVGDVRIGDQIRIRGWLSHYGAVGGGAMRSTSVTRDDSGNGACETIFVNEFDIVAPASNGWRSGLLLALTMLTASLALHFKMPYRPYGA